MRDAVVSYGEMLVRLAAPGRELLLQSPRLEVQVGGAEANVAAALARWGHASRMVTTLPDNALGRACRDALRRHGVDVAQARFAPGRQGLYFLTPGAGLRPAEVLYDRAGSAFALEPAPADWETTLEGAAWLHVSGITCAVSAAAAQSVEAALDAAMRLGVRVSFDSNFRASLWADRVREAPALLRRVYESVSLLFADQRDLAMVFGTSASASANEATRAAFAALPRLEWIAATSRARHSSDQQELSGQLVGRKGSFESRTHALPGIVDRIGSGDAFAAGLLRGLLRGHAPQAAVEFAVAAACVKHTIPGDVCLASVREIEAYANEPFVDVRR